MAKTLWFFAEGEWHKVATSDVLPVVPAAGIQFNVINTGGWLDVRVIDAPDSFFAFHAGDISGGGNRSNDLEWYIEGDLFEHYYYGDWEIYVGRDIQIYAGASPSLTGGDLQMYATAGTVFNGDMYIHANGQIEIAHDGGGIFLDGINYGGTDPGNGSIWVDSSGFLRQT